MARVSRAQINHELEAIEGIIARYPDGVAASALAEDLAAEFQPLSDRTLSRRLAALVADRRIRRKGTTKGVVYRPHVIPAADSATSDRATRGGEEEYVPITSEGDRIRTLVERSPSQKQPVGYDAALLDRYAPGKSWYLPDEIRDRLRMLGATPDEDRPAGTYAREIFDRLLIDLAWASSRLEGNTYSRLDTLNLLQFGQHAEGKDAVEAQMILNHKRAIELLVDGAEEIGFNRYTLLNLHASLSENLLSNPADEGRLRDRAVNITGTSYVPLAIPQRIEELFDQLLAKASDIRDPFEQSFFMMVQLPYLQPFIDVNKRTSRLAANIPLITANLCPLSFVDVPQRAYIDGLLGVYELRRMELLRDVFVWSYERSCAQYRVIRESLGEPNPFRLRYRNELSQAVFDTVSGGHAPRREMLHEWARGHGIATDDLEEFATTALELLVGLHEHSSARYRITPSMFRSWRSRFPAPNS